VQQDKKYRHQTSADGGVQKEHEEKINLQETEQTNAT
jgi:hypothetical protein